MGNSTIVEIIIVKSIPSIEDTNAALAKEFAVQDSKEKDPLSEKSDSNALDTSMQSSSSAAEQAGEIVSNGTAMGSDGRPLREPEGTYFPADSHETDENASKLLTRALQKASID